MLRTVIEASSAAYKAAEVIVAQGAAVLKAILFVLVLVATRVLFLLVALDFIIPSTRIGELLTRIEEGYIQLTMWLKGTSTPLEKVGFSIGPLTPYGVRGLLIPGAIKRDSLAWLVAVLMPSTVWEGALTGRREERVEAELFR